MIYVTSAQPVNVPSEPVLSRSDVWRGLVMKADNALPFVPAITHCVVLKRLGEHAFDREIDFRGDRFVERITLEPEERVTFTRLEGPVLGTIANEIQEDEDGTLSLRFSFALVVQGLAGGSDAEKEYAEGMKGDYLRAVEATLAAMRRIAKGEAISAA